VEGGDCMIYESRRFSETYQLYHGVRKKQTREYSRGNIVQMAVVYISFPLFSADISCYSYSNRTQVTLNTYLPLFQPKLRVMQSSCASSIYRRYTMIYHSSFAKPIIIASQSCRYSSATHHCIHNPSQQEWSHRQRLLQLVLS